MHTCFQRTRTSHFMGPSSWMTSWASTMISARVSARTKLHACMFYDRREHTISVHAFPIPALHELQHEYMRSSKGKLNRNDIQLVFPHECRRGRSTFPHVSPASTTPLKKMNVCIDDIIKHTKRTSICVPSGASYHCVGLDVELPILRGNMKKYKAT